VTISGFHCPYHLCHPEGSSPLRYGWIYAHTLTYRVFNFMWLRKPRPEPNLRDSFPIVKLKCFLERHVYLARRRWLGERRFVLLLWRALLLSVGSADTGRRSAGRGLAVGWALVGEAVTKRTSETFLRKLECVRENLRCNSVKSQLFLLHAGDHELEASAR
jgi:hypothetical protein